MPHCVVEYSNNISCEINMSKLQEALIASNLFVEKDIKIRSLGYDDWLLEKRYFGFVHVVVKILSGRTDAQKLSLSGLIASVFNFEQSINVSVEIVDIDKLSYSKKS